MITIFVSCQTINPKFLTYTGCPDAKYEKEIDIQRIEGSKDRNKLCIQLAAQLSNVYR